jgi:hypothetical protein
MQEIARRIIDKLLSARFLLAISGGVVFVWCSIHKQIEGATITAILMSLFSSYFDRKDRNGNNKPPENK